MIQILNRAGEVLYTSTEEVRMGAAAAGALIYAASTPGARVPDFYATNLEARADIVARAAAASEVTP